MMIVSSYRALGLAAITALTCLQAFGGERSSGPPIDALPVWAANQLKSRGDQAGLRVALIGYNPDIDDPRLKRKGPSRVLIDEEAKAKPLRPDTEMVAWLSSAYPRTLILAAPMVADAGPLQTKAAIGSIAWALKYRPQVLLIRGNLLTSIPKELPELSEALSRCWAQACLPMSISEEAGRMSPPGVLVVSIISDHDARNCEDMSVKDRPGPEEFWDSPIALCLSDGLLSKAPEGMDVARAAAAYLSLGAAALPAAGRTAHLERASLLAQVTPVCSSQAQAGPYLRLLDLNSSGSSRKGCKIHFLTKTFSWDTQVADAYWIRKEVAGLPDEENLRILAGVRGRSLIRHQNAAAQLAQLHPLYLLPQDRGILALRRFSTLAHGSIDPVLSLLRTQLDEDEPNAPFYSLSRDVRVK